MNAPLARWGSTVYCDDVREEAGNKASYMGIYRGVLYVPFIPILLSKFVIVVSFSEPALEDPVPLLIRVYMPGQTDDEGPTFEAPAPTGDPELGLQSVTDVPLENRSRLLTVPITFVPMTLEKAGRIRVHVVRGDELYRLPSLMIARADASEDATASDGDLRAS
jgi:hypothetical protein